MRSRSLGWALALGLSAPGLAQVPQLLSIQGRLEDSAGSPITGMKPLTLRLYDVSAGGSALTSETDPVTLDDKGVFVSTLGDGDPLSLADFSQQLWVGVTVDEAGGGSELTPRIPLRASPYALRAALADAGPAELRIRGITYLAGCDSCAALTDGDDQKNIYQNVIAPMTINSVTCFSDAGTPSVNLQRDDGTPADVLVSNLSCSTSGALTTSFQGSEDSLALGDKLDFVTVAAGGVARRVTVVIKATID